MVFFFMHIIQYFPHISSAWRAGLCKNTDILRTRLWNESKVLGADDVIFC